jgi:FkbM family methyltransferase
MNLFLLNAILRNRSPYSAVLPYNLNWMLHKRDPLTANMCFGPIAFVDVGCRGGLPDELWPMRHILHHIGFDADQQECDRLNSQKHDLFRRDVFPFFVGGTTGDTEFHLFKSPGESSALRPDPRFSKLFAGANFVIEKTVKVQTTTLDSFFQDRPNIPRPDIVKLDTQGTELAILQGATECLRRTSLVEVEVEFLPLYEGQALFPDIMKYMLDSGFDLLYLNRVFQQRKGYPGFAKGQITFGDALFARREDRCGDLDEQRLARYLILLINYGYLDVAYNILVTHRFEDRTKSLFDTYLRQRMGRRKVSQMKKVIIPFIDKVVLFLLHLRKHNAERNDSDRSWPFR